MPPFLQKHGFTLGLLIVLVIGGLLHGWVAAPDFPAEALMLGGVVLIFFLQGLILPLEELGQSLLHGRHHALVLLWNFLFAPLLALGLALLGKGWLSPSISLGLIYLGLLPTTISSAVALTASAGGSTARALVATVMSNLIGVVLTPTLAALSIAEAADVELPILPTLIKVALQVLLPLALGQIVRPFAKAIIAQKKHLFRPTTNSIILLILFLTFAESFANEVWQSAGAGELGLTLLLTLVLLGLVSLGVWASATLLKMPDPSKISAFYCGSQKGLALGVPMASALLADAAVPGLDIGLFVIPLIIYHSAQLILGGFLAARWQEA